MEATSPFTPLAGAKETWASRSLERLCYLLFFFALLSSVHVGATGYNVPIAVFGLVAEASRRGRHIFALLFAIPMSWVLDILRILELREGRWAIVAYIAMGSLLVVAVLKLFMLLALYWLFSEMGGMWTLANTGEAAGSASLDRSFRRGSLADTDAAWSAHYASTAPNSTKHPPSQHHDEQEIVVGWLPAQDSGHSTPPSGGPRGGGGFTPRGHNPYVPPQAQRGATATATSTSPQSIRSTAYGSAVHGASVSAGQAPLQAGTVGSLTGGFGAV